MRSFSHDLRMNIPPPPRTKAIYEEYLATNGRFGYDPLKMWNFMESMELEIVDLKTRLEYFEKRAEKAEEELIDLKLFGKTQPQPQP